MDAERVARDVADRIREMIADAEQRAGAIVREAEEEAMRIRERAEAEANERLAEVRRALADLEGRLGAAGHGSPDRAAEVDPGPVTVPEPAPDRTPEPTPSPVPEPGPEPVPEPTPERIPEPTPPPDEGTPPSPGPEPSGAAPTGNGAEAPGGERSSDVAAARLVAMNMALGGASREEIGAALAADYDLDDHAGLVDEVLAKVARS